YPTGTLQDPLFTGPNKTHRPGYKDSQSVSIYWIHVPHGDQKCPFPNSTIYNKSVYHGVNQLKFAKTSKSVAKEQVKFQHWTLRVLILALLVRIPHTDSLGFSQKSSILSALLNPSTSTGGVGLEG
ncbi:60S ribosomal protein L15, partial [Galemys pyrenaicus]